MITNVGKYQIVVYLRAKYHHGFKKKRLHKNLDEKSKRL
jgi:hypothetical protein